MHIFQRIAVLALLFIFSNLGTTLIGQEIPKANILIISDARIGAENEESFADGLKYEIQTLLQNRFDAHIDIIHCQNQVVRIIEELDKAYKTDSLDLIIAMGSLSSSLMSRRDSFPLPSIAGIILDKGLQQLDPTDKGSSGIKNFNYLESPFDLDRDLRTLHRLYAFEHLAIVGPQETFEFLPVVRDLFMVVMGNLSATYTFINSNGSVDQTLAQLPSTVDAVYLLPLFGTLSEAEVGQFLDSLSVRNLPTSAVFGDEAVQQGALIGYETEDNLQMIPRRIAINTLKILEGIPPEELPVEMPTFSQTLLINLATAKKIDKYPDWDLLGESIQVNETEDPGGIPSNLIGVIEEALKNNLDVKIAEKNPIIAQKEVGIALSDLLPQLEASSAVIQLDPRTAQNSFGSQGETNWTLSGDLSQALMIEPLFANLKIQKLLKLGEEYGLDQTQLDVVLDAADAFLGLLQAKTGVEIQKENVSLTKENYDISRTKEAVGYTGATDINRWESELAQANISLNDAQAQYRQAVFALNQLLNRPIDAGIQLEDATLGQQLLLVADNRILDLVQDYGALKKFSDFLVQEGMSNLPELKQLDVNIQAQERLKKSRNRAFYLPTFAVSGAWDYIIDRWKVTENPNFNTFISQPTWSLALGVQYPLIQGGRRNVELQQTRVSLFQLQDQERLLKQQLELRIRSAMEVAGASFAEVQLAQTAADAADKNYEIIRDYYSQGLSNVTNLIDAQNANLQTALASQNAIFQFINDFLAVERAVGFYYVLASPAERDAFYERLTMYINTH
ncbi:MAG: TolC family protein [Bacteroidota bacterium]